MVHDDVGRHMARAGSFDRAAIPIGMYLAWCANHALISPELADRAGTLVTRVRYREIAGSELAVAGCGGELDDRHLNAEGRAFTEHRYAPFLEAFYGAAGDDPYAVEDEWALYDRLAPTLTGWLMESRGARRPGRRRGRPWWKLWH